uniref:Uncharacterized protein n=1 Tax=Odontella aurita TaxID=265563 RepID=A0A7S4I4U3_9STRA
MRSIFRDSRSFRLGCRASRYACSGSSSHHCWCSDGSADPRAAEECSVKVAAATKKRGALLALNMILHCYEQFSEVLEKRILYNSFTLGSKLGGRAPFAVADRTLTSRGEKAGTLAKNPPWARTRRQGSERAIKHDAATERSPR